MGRYVMRRAVHDVGSSDFHSKAHGGETRCNHDDPEDFDGSEGED
jgi:hypothetical protein